MELHLRRRKIALPEIAGILARIVAQAIAVSAGTSGKRSSGEPSGGKQERPRTGK